MRALLRRYAQVLEMIKFEHTVFALPFALISLLLAARQLPHGVPPARTVVWVVVAMVGARSAAMAFNRLADMTIDAANPRTANRHLPAGVLSAGQVWAFVFASTAVFELAALALGRLCLELSPIVLACVLGYSVTKRFTWLCHLCLGFAIGIAPVGAWLAVRGSLELTPVLLGATVMLWIGGFDVIYALQDHEFDVDAGLHSLPVRIGKANALTVSRIMHACVIGLLIAVGYVAGLHVVYFAGVVVVALLIAYEQALVRPDDLRRVNLAFFTLNGWVSVSLFGFLLADGLLRR